MGVDDIEGPCCCVDAVGVAAGEAHVAAISRGGRPRRLLDDVLGDVDAEYLARSDAGRQVGGDRAGAAADIEEVVARAEVREEVAAGVLRGPPAMAAQHGFVVAVGVDVAVAHR
jgi:hypothetical protein